MSRFLSGGLRKVLAVSLKIGSSAMNFTFATTKRLRKRIDQVALALGPPLHRSLLQPSGTEVLQRTSWDCGCVVDYIDGFVADSEPVLRWATCGEHRQIGLLSSSGRRMNLTT